jgi:hypothetical protein
MRVIANQRQPFGHSVRSACIIDLTLFVQTDPRLDRIVAQAQTIRGHF